MWWNRAAIPQDLLVSTLLPIAPGRLVGMAVMGLPPRGSDYPYAVMSHQSYLVIGVAPDQLPPGGQAFALPPVYFHGFWN